MMPNWIDITYEDYITNEHNILLKLEKDTKNGNLLCPDCNRMVSIHGTYLRKIKVSEFETIQVKIYQVKCLNNHCKKTHAILPSFIVPKKQYSKEIIQKALEEKGGVDCPADNSTIIRWKNLKIDDENGKR